VVVLVQAALSQELPEDLAAVVVGVGQRQLDMRERPGRAMRVEME